MVTSQELIALIKPVMAKAKELDDGKRSRLDYREAALALGHSEGLSVFLGLALEWENDILDWIDHVQDGLIEA
jgi:hypothetical protein